VGSPANWRCVALKKFSRVKLVEGAWRTAPNHSRPASCVTETDIDAEIMSSAIHKKDTEEVARVAVEQGSFSRLQWNSDYAARGERGDPRGRKSGAGPGATNPRWPARAEGEKRLRSATRNP
jgi:hypothetical protein